MIKCMAYPNVNINRCFHVLNYNTNWLYLCSRKPHSESRKVNYDLSQLPPQINAKYFHQETMFPENLIEKVFHV